jgi:hypothetical protein
LFLEKPKSKREKGTKRKKSGETVRIIDVKALSLLSDPARLMATFGEVAY